MKKSYLVFQLKTKLLRHFIIFVDARLKMTRFLTHKLKFMRHKTI